MNDHDDWVLSKESIPKGTPAPFNANEWQLSAPENRRKDNLLESAIMAPIRIVADTIGGAYNAAQKIPEYWQKAKTEVPAFHNPLNAIKHPLHRAGQTLAGALEGAQALNHLPRNVAEYAENRLNLLPQGWSQKVPVAPDITGAIENTFGQPKYPGEALARGAGRNVLNEAALASAINKIPHLTKSGATKKLRQNQQRMNALKKAENDEMINLYHGKSPELADSILENGLTSPKYEPGYGIVTNNQNAAEAYGARTHGESPDILKITIPRSKINEYLHPENKDWTVQANKPRGAEDSQIFGLKQPIPKEYISKVGYHDTIEEPHNVAEKMKPAGALNIKPELIEDMRKYMPNDAAFRDLVDAAHTGDYNKLFKLQSAVGQLSAKRSRALFSPEERIKGQAGFQAINALLDDMHKEMKGKGLLKESELLRQGRNDFRRYSKFKKYKYGLGALAAGYAVPKNSLTDIGKKIWSIVGQK